MSDSTPFKTPLPFRTAEGRHKYENEEFYTPTGKNSDSEESVTSNPESTGSGASSGDISLVAEFDDMMRMVRHLKAENLEVNNSYLELVEQVKLLNNEFFCAVEECRRLQNVLEVRTSECTDWEVKLKKARQLLDREKTYSRNIMRERNELMKQQGLIKDLLLKDNNTSSQVKDKLSFLNNNNFSDYGYNHGLSAIKEINSTGSILSDFSYSRSEDDLDESLTKCGKRWQKHRPSTEGLAEPAIKKRRSSGNKAVEISASDTVRATTTVTVTKEGPIMATSIIESIPKSGGNLVESNKGSAESYATAPPANLVFESWARESPRKPERALRPHSFQSKTVVMPDTCGPCEKRIRFGKTAVKCKECKALCHVECADNLPLPCIAAMHTPSHKHVMGVIGDYTPTISPMVPALLIHCVNEIELRGFTEIGLYRIPGAERDVKSLKEKFLKGRGAPCLNQVDIHVICGCVKDFLRSLNEPIVTHNLWSKFVQAAEARDKLDVLPLLYQVISELPQPNRDSLAYMILHLKKVAESKDCKMNISNLAKVFGPTIVGYSSENPDPNDLLMETRQQNNVMEHLMNIPSDYWESFVRADGSTHSSKLQQTPSTDSLLRSTTARNFFTPNRTMMRRKQKFFASPNNNK